jgi:uncharacterized protein YbjT (DUF2867 family)
MASDANAQKVILVTGATGRVGKEVVARLAKEPNVVVRAATRDKGDYAKSLGAHEVTNFDLTDKSTWAPAMEGVTHLFSSTQDKYISEHMEFAKWLGEDKAMNERIKHVVRISCFGADTNTNQYDPDVHVSRADHATKHPHVCTAPPRPFPSCSSTTGGRRSASSPPGSATGSRQFEVTFT